MYLQSETIPGFQEIKVSLAELTPTAHKDEWMFGMVVTSLSIDGRLQHPLLCISKEVYLNKYHMFGIKSVTDITKPYFVHIGNNRYYAALDLGYTEIDIILLDNPNTVYDDSDRYMGCVEPIRSNFIRNNNDKAGL